MNDSSGHGIAVSLLSLQCVFNPHYKLFSIAPIIAEILSDPMVVSARGGFISIVGEGTPTIIIFNQ